MVVYPNAWGFRYTCRNEEGKVVHDSPYVFRSRRDAADQARFYWPQAKVTFDLT